MDASAKNNNDDSITSTSETITTDSKQPSDLRPPSVMSSSASTTTSTSKPSGIKPPSSLHISRIGRPCLSHSTPKAGPPPIETKNETITSSNNNINSNYTNINNNLNTIMRRQNEDLSRSQLADVDEESENDLVLEKVSQRSSKSPETSIFSKSSNDRKISSGSVGSDVYLEATGRRLSSDQGTVLTADTDCFIIGQRVWVGGIRPGHIAYIGETHFAPGDWAGIVLDESNGKNDGCVSGKRYFQCEPKRGIFSRLTRLTREPLDNIDNGMSMDNSMRSVTSPLRSGSASPTASVKSGFPPKSSSKSNLTVGDRVIVSSGLGSRTGTLKYLGETKFSPGTWCGIQLDEPTGKNDGSVDGVKYFECQSKYGIFVPIAKVTISPVSRRYRLSRANSRESLTSVGTVGSTMSTATSRLRMSAQKLSNAKSLTSTKTSFSLQDVLREKQNHIEQLLIERDIDRQEADNQTIMYQKDINQLKEKIIIVEKHLDTERNKIVDLQANVDEATFCSDELNAQTQVYKEKIENLEKELNENKNGGVPATAIDLALVTAKDTELIQLRNDYKIKCEELEKLTSEMTMKRLEEKLNETTSFEEEITYLKKQVEELSNELMEKNYAMEKQFIDMKNNENLISEELGCLKRQQNANESAERLENLIKEKDEVIMRLKDCMEQTNDINHNLMKEKDNEIVALKNDLVLAKNDTKMYLEELDVLKTDIQNYMQLNDEKKIKLDETIGNLSSYEEKFNENSRTITELNKNLQNKNDEIEKHLAEINNLTKVTEKLTAEMSNFEKKSIEELSEIKKAYEANREARETLQNELNDLKKKLSNNDNELLLKDKQLEEYEILINALQDALKESNSNQNNLLNDINHLKLQTTANSNDLISKLTEDNKLLIKTKENCINELEINLKRTVDELKSVGEVKESVINELNNLKLEFIAKEQLCEDLDKNLITHRENYEREINELNVVIDGTNNQANDLKVKIIEKDNEISALIKVNENQSKLQEETAAKLEKMTKLNDENLQKIKSYEETNESINDNYRKLQLSYDELNRNHNTLELKTNELIRQKMSLENDIILLRSNSVDTNSDIVNLTEKLQTTENTYSNLVDKLNLEKNNLETINEELKGNLSKENSINEKFKGNYEKLINEKLLAENELNNTIETLKEQFANEKTNLLNEIDNQKKYFTNETNNLLKKFDDQLNTSNSLNNQLNETITKLEVEIKQLKTELDVKKVENDNNDKAITKQMNELLLKTEENERIFSESKLNEEKLIHSLDETNNTISVLKTELNNKLIAIEELQNHKEILNKQFENELNEQKIIDENLMKVNNEMKTKLTKLEEENALLVNNSYLFEMKFKNLEDEQVDLVNKNEELSQHLEENLTEMDTLKLSLNKIEEEKQELNKKLEVSEQALIEKENSIKLMLEEMSTLQQGGETSVQELNNFKNEIVNKTTELNILQVKLNEVNNLTESLKKDLSIRINEITSKDETLLRLTSEIDEKNTQIGELQSKVDDNLTKAEHIQSDMATIKNDLDIKTKQLFTKDQELSNLKNELAQKDENLSKIMNELADKNILIENSEMIIENSNEKITDQSTVINNYELNKKENLEKLTYYENINKSLEKLNEEYKNEVALLKLNVTRKDLELNALSKKVTIKDTPILPEAGDSTTTAELEFLNSIIADMQKKNETLIARCQVLEAGPSDYSNPLFGMPTKKIPAPRMFCDICDIFDKHDTEDCPLQSSDSPPATPLLQNNLKERVIPPPRKYCDSCEVFGHEVGECDDEDTF